MEKPQKNLNSTFTKNDVPDSSTSHKNHADAKQVQSYDITPARHELPPEELEDPENYNIADLKSDEDTDDEDAPRKVVPKWAEGIILLWQYLIKNVKKNI